MNINEIELFMNLSETLHFTKASAISNLSPSAFSRAIKRIEEEIGEKLFERNNREVSLTRAGEIFKFHAEEIIQIWNKGKQAINLEKGLVSGELDIYCSVTAAYGILPDILNDFRKDYPDVNIRLKTGDAESALILLTEKEVDFAIAAVPDKLPDNVEYMFITETPLVWIKSKNNCLPNQGLIDFHRNPLILPRQGIARSRFDTWCKNEKTEPSIYAQVTGNEAIIAMVYLGCGIGLVPEMVLKKSPVMNTITVIKKAPLLKPYKIGIFANKKNLATPLTKAFWKTACDF